MLSPGQWCRSAFEDIHAPGDHIVDVHGRHVAEQEDALVELGLHQLSPQLFEDSKADAQWVRRVAE